MSPRRRGPRTPLLQGAAARALMGRVQAARQQTPAARSHRQHASGPPDRASLTHDRPALCTTMPPDTGRARWTTHFSTGQLRRPGIPLWVQIDLAAHLRLLLGDRTDDVMDTANTAVVALLEACAVEEVRIDVTDTTLLISGTTATAPSHRTAQNTPPPPARPLIQAWNCTDPVHSSRVTHWAALPLSP